MIWIGAGGEVLFQNAAANEILGGNPFRALDIFERWPLAAGVSTGYLTRCDKTALHCQVGAFPAPNGATTTTVVIFTPVDAVHDADVALRDTNTRLRFIIDMIPQAMCVFDAQDRYVLWNQRYADLYPDIKDHLRPGAGFEEILKISLAGGQNREEFGDPEEWLRNRLEKHREPVSQEEQQLRDGRWVRHDDRRTPDGGAIGMRIDITELKQREEWLRQLFEANPMPMLLCDAQTLVVLEANNTAISFYGHAREDLLGMVAQNTLAKEEAAEFAHLLMALDGDCEGKTVWRQNTASGAEKHVLVYVRILREGGQRRLLLTIADVSERIAAEAHANHLALHDALTGLPNRMQFLKAVHVALSTDSDGLEPVGILYLDLDGFKPINDTFGHAAGDDVLILVGERLRGVTARRALVARLGGDEFAIVHRGRPDETSALAEQCIEALREPFLLKGMEIQIGVSVGIAISSHQMSDPGRLIREADDALYRAKAAGKNTWRRCEDRAA